MTDLAPARSRLAIIDVARGVAIVAMVAYHIAWDLSHYRLIGIDVAVETGWVVFARSILSAFLLLAGFSLVLAHGEGMRWRSFWKRELILVGAAALVSLGTWYLFGSALAWFGVLHAIALASLIALPFLRLNWIVTLLAAAVFIIPPRLVRFEAFNQPELAWIGFWQIAPPSADLVPVFPWAGVLLLGVVAGQLFVKSSLPARAAAVQPKGRVWRWLALAGRWSLVIYLVHQPLLHAVLIPISNSMQQSEEISAADFMPACQSSCELGGGETGYCLRYCSCAFEQVQTGEIGDFVMRAPENLSESEALAQMAALCSAMALEPISLE